MCFLMTGGVLERVDRCSDGRWREHGDRPPHPVSRQGLELCIPRCKRGGDGTRDGYHPRATSRRGVAALA